MTLQAVPLRWVVRMSGVTALVALGLSSAGMDTARAQAQTGVTPAATEAAPAPQLGDEVVEQRSATSRTYAQDDGSLITRVFSLPVNFRDDGRWRAIDTTLVSAGQDGDIHQRANDGDVRIPSDLGRPIRVSYRDAWLSFAMRGAGGAAAAIDRDTAHFDKAATGVDATYYSDGSYSGHAWA